MEHKAYLISCETRRMTTIHESIMLDSADPLENMPLLFIRYNPDTFRIDGVIKRITKTEREQNLMDYLDEIRLRKEDARELQIKYMYYDTSSKMSRPLICMDDEFPSTLCAACKNF